jgi:hypothetical protein
MFTISKIIYRRVIRLLNDGLEWAWLSICIIPAVDLKNSGNPEMNSFWVSRFESGIFLILMSNVNGNQHSRMTRSSTVKVRFILVSSDSNFREQTELISTILWNILWRVGWYTQYRATADLHNLLNTVAHALVLPVSISRLLATALNTGIITLSIFKYYT